MSESLYLVQVVILGAVMLWFTRRQWVMQLQILGWTFLNIILLLQFEISNLGGFYSNDQDFYVKIIQDFFSENLTMDLDWWLGSPKTPYTIPAAILFLVGLHPILALKAISLLALIALTAELNRVIAWIDGPNSLLRAYITATAGIGIFFATLALRETLMMLLALWFFTGKSPATKLLCLLCLVLLRPHLSAALFIGTAIAYALRKYPITSVSSILMRYLGLFGAPVLGYYVYSFGLWWQYGITRAFGHTWGISPVLRIASNYVGLQFLTVRESTVEFSITSLLLLRLLLSETIIIPLLFTTVIILTRRQSFLMQSVMWSFGIYVGIVTNTDFNSFRQNIPFMPVMGLVVLLAWKEHRERHRDVQTLPLTVPRET